MSVRGGGGRKGGSVREFFLNVFVKYKLKWPVHSERLEAIYTAVLNVLTPSERTLSDFRLLFPNE